MALNSNFPELATTTLNLWGSKEFANAFSGHNPLFYRMRKKGNVQKGGLGLKALEPLMYPDANGPTVNGVTDPYQPQDPQATEGFTNAEYTWCEKILDVSVASLELDQQGSETRKLGHLDAIKDISMKKFMEALNADLWRAPSLVGANGASRAYLGSIRCYMNRGGTGTTSTGTPAALAEQIGAVAESALTTVGGIDRSGANAAYWCTPILTATLAMTLENMQAVISLGTRGSDSPDFVATTRANYNTLAGLLIALQRFTAGSSLADAGFKALMFDGADVVFDDNCPAANVFAMNTEYLKFRCLNMEPKFQYKADPYRPIEHWEARFVGQITSGNLGRVQARATAFGA